jgi:hypothetical protein
MYNFSLHSKRRLSIQIPNSSTPITPRTQTQTQSQIQTPLFEAKTVSLFSQPYLDTYNQCYTNIVVVNLFPKGPLGQLVKFIKFPKLSEFKEAGSSKQCGYALQSIEGNHTFNSNCNCNCKSNLMSVDEVPTLISYLVSCGYTVDTSITKMFNSSEIRFDTNNANKLICFITYHGD